VIVGIIPYEFRQPESAGTLTREATFILSHDKHLRRHMVRTGQAKLPLFLVIVAVAQDAPTQQAAAPAAAELESRRRANAENSTLDDSPRVRIDELYGKAIQRLPESGINITQRDKLIKEIKYTADDLVAIQDQLNEFVPTNRDAIANEMGTAESLAAQLNEVRTQLTLRRGALETVTNESSRRAERRPQLPDMRTAAQQELESVVKHAATAAPTGEIPELTETRHVFLQARTQLLQSRLTLIE
jgi:hypothetical protein